MPEVLGSIRKSKKHSEHTNDHKSMWSLQLPMALMYLHQLVSMEHILQLARHKGCTYTMLW